MPDFKWTLSRPGISVEFETGSIKEALGLLTDEGSEIEEMFGFRAQGLLGQGDTALATGTVETPAAPATAAAEAPARRTRGPNKSAAAVAPAPMPVPDAAPPAPPAPVADDGIPEALRRAPAATAPPPPPLLPAAPPIVPAAAPPTGVLGGKIADELERRAAGAVDGGAALVAWLAHPTVGLVVAGAPFADAIAVLRMTQDEKLGAVATALSLS